MYKKIEIAYIKGPYKVIQFDNGYYGTLLNFRICSSGQTFSNAAEYAHRMNIRVNTGL